jgi:hypothetical protein
MFPVGGGGGKQGEKMAGRIKPAILAAFVTTNNFSLLLSGRVSREQSGMCLITGLFEKESNPRRTSV